MTSTRRAGPTSSRTVRPAEQHLCAILLEHDAQSGELRAVGTLGGELFNRFFDKYDFKLAIDYGSSKARAAVSGTTPVSELTVLQAAGALLRGMRDGG